MAVGGASPSTAGPIPCGGARARSATPAVDRAGVAQDTRRFRPRPFASVWRGRVPSDPHHLTFTQPRALGHRVSDEFTVPVCRIHHRELHRSGDELGWWQKLNIDPVPVALRLWEHSQADVAPAPIREAVTQAQAAKTPEISVQDRADTSSGLG